MVDIHSHVVWDVDDGAPDAQVSLAMLDAAWNAGTTDIVATPHSNSHYTYDAKLVSERIRELNQRTECRPRVLRGCDFHLSFDNLDRLLENPAVYTINDTQYLLVECPHFHVGKHTESVLKRLLDLGIAPIVTHPERNPVLQKDLQRVASWVDAGCLVQVTALSILGGFGSVAKATSARLLDRGLTHIVASDAHDPKHRHPRLDEAFSTVRIRYGEAAANNLFDARPRAVIDGTPLAGEIGTSIAARKWWKFWQSG